MSLVEHFTTYQRWRNGIGQDIERLRRWIADNDLGDAQNDQRLQRLLERLREDKLVVAFVAEFSRGKSELINAIFFAGYGNRILPSSTGRTTMCPTELYYDATRPAAIELLPIESRARQASIAELKTYREEWASFPLDTDDAMAMAEALKHVGEHKRVTAEAAQDLGFAIDAKGETGLQPDADGCVDIPCWRHALINFPHPLLEQGLVILDTPGLNAIGAEPELTLSLLPSAHAVLFILAADTGVTQSDLAVWRDHIGAAQGRESGRLVALNKIDGLWDGLRSELEIDDEIDAQVDSCAHLLGVPRQQVFPVSAQKGLVAKISKDNGLLARSRLPALEQALAEELVPAKREIVGESVGAEVHALTDQIHALLDTRLDSLREQLGELLDLRGKNQGVVDYMMRKVRQEKEDFEKGLQQYYAVRSVFSQLTNNLFSHLGMEALRGEVRRTRTAMKEASFTLRLSEAMNGFFIGIRRNFAQSAKEVDEIGKMMSAMYLRFAEQHGVTLDAPASFSLHKHEKEFDRLEKDFQKHFTLFNILTREKQVLTQQFFETVAAQTRKIFDAANRDAELWLRAVMAPLETRVREIQLQLKRRLESIKRIHEATETLEERIGELEHSQSALLAQQTQLAELVARLTQSVANEDGKAGSEADRLAA